MDQSQSEWPPGTSIPIFEKNLRALSEVQPELAERMCWPVIGDHLRELPDGGTAYVGKNANLPLDLKPEDFEFSIQRALAAGGEDASVLVFGIGLGEIVMRLLAADSTRVVAWDRDPWMVRTFLGRCDVSSALRSGRLQLAMVADLVALIDNPMIETRVEHPRLAALYARELSWLQEGPRYKRVLLSDGLLYVDSLGRALHDEGYSVWTLESERLAVEELDRTVRLIEPQALAVINYCEGLVEFTHQHGIELMVWEIDPFTQRPSVPTTSSTHAHIFSYREEHAREMRQLGFQNVEYLPLAADTQLRHRVDLAESDKSRYGSAISFVGSSMLENAQKLAVQFGTICEHWRRSTGHATSVQSILDEILAAQRQSLDEWLVPGAIEQFAPGLLEWTRAQLPEFDLSRLIGEVAASERRLSYASKLAEFGLDVWGDQGWKQAEQFGFNYRGSATHAHDLTRIYCASKINLDVGRLYQNDIVTMRVFDILACGGFALVEHNDALEELFRVGIELESYRCLEECRDKVEYFLAHPERAQAIAERGFEAVVARHTFKDRVTTMLGALGVSRLERELGLTG